MKKNHLLAARLLFICLAIFLCGFRPVPGAPVLNNNRHYATFQHTERPLDIVITHVHEGKQVRMSSIHNIVAGNRLTFIYHDGTRVVLNFLKPIRTGNYEIRDRTSELQAIYYPVGRSPITLLGFVTMYTLKPITGRVVQFYDNDHEIHLSSSSIFAF